jgi:hypothetical protein
MPHFPVDLLRSSREVGENLIAATSFIRELKEIRTTVRMVH